MGVKGIFKQKDTGKFWGHIMQIVQQEAFVIQSIILIFTLVTTSSVLQIRGYAVPIWMLAVLVVVAIICGGLLVFKLGLPSYFRAFNDQFYKHGNLLKNDIDEIKKNQEELEKTQNEILNLLKKEGKDG